MKTTTHYLFALILAATPAFCQAQDLFALEEDAMQAAAAAVAPSVVRIETVGGLERVGRVLVSEGPTTGLVVSAEGHILSSAFNFLGQPTSVLVTLDSGTRKPAEIIAKDNSRMLVLLKIEVEEDLPVPEIVPREEINVGSWSLALGRAHDAEGVSISAGIISAKDRIWGKAVQTDAKISPNNYGGPLIDIRGRVIGMLTPMSPQGAAHAAAGAEWYDSGIGFAAPLADIMPRLDHMKQGNDLHPGVMGIALKGSDIYNLPAEIANVRPNSPAYEAELKAGDVIISAEGEKIVRQAQLKHVLGRKYAGDEIALVVKRGDDELEKAVKLVEKLEPFVHAYLGFLPARNIAEDGVTIRAVLPATPALRAGLEVGDRIVAIGEKQIANYDEALEVLNAAEPGDSVEVKVVRNSEEQAFTVELGELAASVPQELAVEEQPAVENPHELAGEGEIKLPEETSTSFVYAPETYSPDRSYGLLVWLQPPGAFKKEDLLKRWKSVCDERGLVLLAPHPADSARWRATEVEFVRKSIAEANERFSIDPHRIVAFGNKAGGSMAYLVAFNQREVIRGVATFDAAIPMRGPAPDNEPTQRVSIFSAVPQGSQLAERIEQAMKVLTDKKFPVTTRQLPKGTEALDDEAFGEVVRWLDAIDRL